jgi:uncharacterized membrane protein
MPVWLHEWVVAPLALALMLRHASRALGFRRAVLEASVLAAYGFALEWTAMAVFSAYRYSDAWRVAPAGVPIAIALMWAAIILAAMALAVRAGARSPLERAALAAALAIALDLLMEPTASRIDLWHWTPPGPWLGVPIGNFVGWMVVVGGYALGAERGAAEASLVRTFVRRTVLALATIAGLVAVGFAWRAIHAESRLAGGADWCAWALLVCAPVLLSHRRVAFGEPEDPTLAVRLGRLPGGAPLGVFVLVATTFVLDVASLGGRDLALIAAGTCVSLAASLRSLGAKAAARRGLLEQLLE